MCKEGKKDMVTNTAPVKKKSVKKPILRKNKFAKMSRNDWIEANEVSKENRGVSKLTYKDLYGGK